MESYKVFGAIFGTALFVLGLQNLGGTIFHEQPPAADKQGFLIEVAEAGQGAGDAAGGAAASTASIGTLLASADPTKGADVAKACASCHNFEKGGPNKTGPNLYDVVERPIAAHEGFSYSEGAQAHKGENWTYEHLNTFLTNPKGFIKGTKMAFGGVKSDAKRADLIAYLASLSDAPKPFPAP